jgi:hypothetical protein
MTALLREQRLLKHWLWIGAVLIWGWRFWQGLLLHQLYEAPFIFVGADNTFWLYYATQLPALVVEQYSLALGLDTAWLLLAAWGVWSTHLDHSKPKKQQLIGLIFWLLYINYFIIYNSIATHHEHILVAGLFCFLLLIFQKIERFVLVFIGLRYYALWVLFSAALWKIGLGSWNDAEQLTEILKHQHIDYLITNPEACYSDFIYWLLAHPLLCQLLWCMGWLVELSFGIGFFTRRFDRWLGVLWVLFFVLDYGLMGLCFTEFCIFVVVFHPWREIWKHYQAPIRQ